MSAARLRRTLLAALAAALACASTAAAQDSVRLNQVGGARFPDRSYVLTLPDGMYLDEGRVDVRENGELVDQISIVPADDAAANQFGVVLVVDASNSMRGKPIEDAVAAARAYAERRNENQQVAIVAFNSETDVLLSFTTDAKAIDAALDDEPPLARGTRIYDGIATALRLLREARIAAGSIIVLSDGSDTGSDVTPAAAAEQARDAHVRIFSVGLRSRSFKPKPLEELATAARGGYSEAASSADLEPIFDELGARLASEYLLRYRSTASPKTDIHVAVTIEGLEGLAKAEYTTPALPDDARPPFHRSLAERFWRSPGGMLATGVGAALLIALALLMLVRPRARTLRRRMAEFVSLAVPEADSRDNERAPMLASAERSFGRLRWWVRFKEELELAEIQSPAAYIVVATLSATLLAVLILFMIAGLLIAWIGLGVPFVVRAVIRRKLERKRDAFADQLPDNLQVLSSALRAGHGLVGALSVVVEDSAEPSQSEFRRVIADEQLGVPLEEAFGAVARRMASRDLEQVAVVAGLQRETGGNTAEVLDRVAETVRSRFELRRLVKTLTTQGRMSRWVVSLLPVGLLVLISLINPEYMRPLYTQPLGRVLLVAAGIMVVAGSLVIKRIINIKV